MTRYLLAAEADQIQDFLFRASKLREVVGGSHLLSRFCEEAPRKLRRGASEEDFIVTDGGVFRILFDTEAEAIDFGRRLAEIYRDCADGVLTVAKPVPYEAGGFEAANQDAATTLRRAKRRGDPPTTPAHLPQVAFCASCGIGLAREHKERPAGEGAKYLCAACDTKAAEGRRGRFLSLFEEAVKERLPAEQKDRPLRCPDMAEKVAALDDRRYVAYLLADGNGMGVWFNRCRQPDQLHQLSDGLTATLRRSLAEPCPALLQRVEEITHGKAGDLLPVLPLILGGDDCLALLPAKWALDFARRFCKEYERNLAAVGREAGLPTEGTDAPTVSAAVIICKGTYPHRLAHARGEVLLEAAKRLAKASAAYQSVVAFEVVTGNSLPIHGVESVREVRNTLQPFPLAALKDLMDQRFELRNLGGKRRAELRQLYGLDELPERMEAVAGEWSPKLEALLGRISRQKKVADALRKALAVLGDSQREAPGHWKRVTLPGERFWGHALPDLVEAWRYALSLDRKVRAYEEA